MNVKNPPKRSTRGFTLIELLVVVSVIAILIAVLLPALNGVRSAAQKAQSASNLRQLATVFITYAEDDRRNFFPILPIPPADPNQRVPTEENLFQGVDGVGSRGQAYYGGFAGLFNLAQGIARENAGFTPTDVRNQSIFDRGFYFEWSSSQSRWVRETTGGTDYPDGVERGSSTPLMEPYMDQGTYQMLQSPADESDGDDDASTNLAAATNFLPVSVPDITTKWDVAWFTVSYLYVAGVSGLEGANIAFLADETNSSDIGGGAFASNGPGSFRNGLNDPELQGYLPVDNHGEEGGHAAFTDGSVRFIQGKNTMEAQMFDEINRTTAQTTGVNETDAVMTID